MKTQILFRVDVNEVIGRGHLSRCLAIADMLKEDFAIGFICLKKNFNSTVNLITKFPVEYIEEEHDVFNLISEELMVFLDGYQFSEDYKKQLQSKVHRLIEINDIPYEAKNVDIIINHTPGITKTQFGNTTAELYLGLDYAMLRASFLDYAKNNKSSIGGHGVFVCFGGADPYNLGFGFVENLLSNNFNSPIYWVANQTTSKFDFKNVEILHQLSEQQMTDYMLKSKVLIIPSSVLSLEAIALRKPFFTGYFVANQKLIFEGLRNQELAECFGALKTDNDIEKATSLFMRFFDDKEKQSRISKMHNVQLEGNSNVLISDILSA